MKVGKGSAALLALAGLVLLIGCGKKEEAVSSAPAATGGGASKPPSSLQEQIRNNPRIPADQRAKYGGG